MAFPDLTLAPGRTNVSTATGVPDNGLNEFAHNWDLTTEQIDPDAELLDIKFVVTSSAVTAATFVSFSADRLRLIVNFTQSGAGTMRVEATQVWTGSA